MANAAPIEESRKGLDYQPLLLSVTITVSWILFQTIYIIAISAESNTCMYAFWAPSADWLQNPFWYVVSIVAGLALLTTHQFLVGVVKRLPYYWFTAAFFLVFLGFWASGLYDLWNAMLYERGILSADEWFRDMEKMSFAIRRGIVYECDPAI